MLISLCMYVAVCKCTPVCLSAGVVYACVCERVGRVRWKRLERASELRRVSGKEVTRKPVNPQATTGGAAQRAEVSVIFAREEWN